MSLSNFISEWELFTDVHYFQRFCKVKKIDHHSVFESISMKPGVIWKNNQIRFPCPFQWWNQFDPNLVGSEVKVKRRLPSYFKTGQNSDNLEKKLFWCILSLYLQSFTWILKSIYLLATVLYSLFIGEIPKSQSISICTWESLTEDFEG